MIGSGVKAEEYREIKPYWCKRFTGYKFLWYSFRNGHNNPNVKGYTHARFSYGYTRRTMTFEIDSITIGKQNGRYWVHRPFERSFYCSKSLCMTYRRKVVVQGGIIDL